MLDLDIHPGKALGPFVLGSPLPVVIDWLIQQEHVIHNVELDYDTQRPHSGNITLFLPASGVVLRFDGKSQRLRSVEAQNISAVKLKYNKNILAGPATPATMVHLYKMFGPTHPGEFLSKELEFRLSYSGIIAVFQIPEAHRAFCEQRHGQPPLELPDGTTPLLSRLVLLPLPTAVDPMPALSNGFYLEPVLIVPTKGLYFCHRRINLSYGQTAGDCIATLGNPDTVCYESDVPLLHMTESAAELRSSLAVRSVFYNYRRLGLDVVIGGVTQRIQKFVLHSNVPGHVDFNDYQRCNFLLDVGSDTAQALFVTPPLFGGVATAGATAAAGAAAAGAGATGGGAEIVTRPRAGSDASGRSRQSAASPGAATPSPIPILSERLITPETEFDTVQQFLGSAGRPVVRDTALTTNPFGPSLYYAYAHVVFEVTSAGSLASVCIFSERKHDDGIRLGAVTSG